MEFVLSNRDYIRNNIKMKYKVEVLEAILNELLVHIVDNSFFPDNSKYILVSWYIVKDSVVIAKGDFITIVIEDYRHPYAAELCGVLSVFIILDYLLTKYSHIDSVKKIKIRSDCQAVINDLGNISPIIALTKHLHEIVTEIKLIKNR